MGDFDRAVLILLEEQRKVFELALRCPRCGETNLPNIIAVELREDGVAYCNVCSRAWKPDLCADSPS